MSFCNYLKRNKEKCKNVVKNTGDHCSDHKKCLVEHCNNVAQKKKYCRTHYNQILCNERTKNNCSSPNILCDEAIGYFSDFSDFSDIEISESFFDKPVCDYTEADLPDDLFEGIEGIEKEKPEDSAISKGTKITIFDHLKGFRKGKDLKKDGRKRKSMRKKCKKSRRKSSKRKRRK